MGFISILSLIVFMCYTILIFSFFIGWNCIKKYTYSPPKEFPFVSVLVAVRNEELVLSDLMTDLQQQDYPADRFEIIMIDDHSEDQSAQLAESHEINKRNLLKILRLTGEKTGKKQALQTGIYEAQGDLILTTDADCRVKKSWISTFVSFYLSKNKPKMIIGLVDLKSTNIFFDGLQNLEFLSLIGTGTGAAGIRRPIWCNGANLMFEKDAYFQLTNPLNESVISGDDTFLMHRLKKRFPSQIKIIKAKNAIVHTHPACNICEFVNQRKRWASKASHYSDFDIILTGIMVSFTNLAFFIWMIYGCFSPNKTFIYLYILKLIADWLMITPVLSFFGKKKLHIFVPVLSVIYPIYYSWIAFSSIFYSGFNWKGREYNHA